MTELPTDSKVAVIGAGTMGAGIAQVAAAANHAVLLIDVADGVAAKAKDNIKAGLKSLITRGKKTQTEVDQLLENIETEQSLENIGSCKLVIEAIVENIEIKQNLIEQIEELSDDSTIIASNTSSISISALGANAKRPANIVGMHFFNPAAVLKLVEVVSGLQTSKQVADTIYQTAKAWGKKPVHTQSTPGFIVNRVARPFYAEALRSLSEQLASVETIDALMRSCGGFKMGPLELTDLIGQDVNCAVTESVYSAYFQDKRFMPSVLQAEMVAAGLLGRKSGKGFYNYTDDNNGASKDKSELIGNAQIEPQLSAWSSTSAQTVKIIGHMSVIDSLLAHIENSSYQLEKSSDGLPGIEVGEAIIQLSDGRTATQRAADQCTPNVILFDYAADYQNCDLIALSVAQQANADALADAIGFFQTLGKQVCVLKDLPGMQVLRTISMLVNEAYDAVNQNVCDTEAVDIAMQAGVAYPKGPIAWGREIGLAYLVLTLDNIQKAYGEERYRVSPLLRSEQYV